MIRKQKGDWIWSTWCYLSPDEGWNRMPKRFFRGQGRRVLFRIGYTVRRREQHLMYILSKIEKIPRSNNWSWSDVSGGKGRLTIPFLASSSSTPSVLRHVHPSEIRIVSPVYHVRVPAVYRWWINTSRAARLDATYRCDPFSSYLIV
jgi:hypothetical protein